MFHNSLTPINFLVYDLKIQCKNYYWILYTRVVTIDLTNKHKMTDNVDK